MARANSPLSAKIPMQLLAKRKKVLHSRNCMMPVLIPQRRHMACKKNELLKLAVNLARLQLSLTGAAILKTKAR
jgi:hypothetical protein